MTATDVRKLEHILGQITELHDELAHLQGGVAVLHMDAAVAALEDRIRLQLLGGRLGRPTVLPYRRSLANAAN